MRCPRKHSGPRGSAPPRRSSSFAGQEPELAAPPPSHRPSSSSTAVSSDSAPQEPRLSCAPDSGSVQAEPVAPLTPFPDTHQPLRPKSRDGQADMLHRLRSIPTEMDYKGQKLAEQIFQGIILVSAVIGFIYGYLTEQFCWTVYIVMAGFAFSCVLTLPPWPMYRRNPLKWLPVQEADDKKPKIKRHVKN